MSLLQPNLFEEFAVGESAFDEGEDGLLVLCNGSPMRRAEEEGGRVRLLWAWSVSSVTRAVTVAVAVGGAAASFPIFGRARAASPFARSSPFESLFTITHASS